MSRQIKPTLKWKDAPDTITPELLSRILGKSPVTTRKYFNEADFPKIKDDFIADKEAVRLWCQGLYKKRN